MFRFIKYYIQSLRVKQWTKNLLLFAGLVFSRNLTSVSHFYNACIGFALFSFCAGNIYVLNDIIDRKKDAIHPEKRFRPVASGNLGVVTGIITSCTALVLISMVSFYYYRQFSYVIFFYIGLQVFYSTIGKNIVILDILAIGLGFVLRAMAGAVIINVPVSHWLLLCTFLLALFLAAAKRKYELTQYEDGVINLTRTTLEFYSNKLLDQIISIVAASTIMSYALYTIDPVTVAKFKTTSLIYSVPFVMYGLFRYLYLIYKENSGGSPDKVILSDRHIILNMILWILCVLLIIYNFSD